MNTQMDAAGYEARFVEALTRAGFGVFEASDAAAEQFPSDNPEADAAEWLTRELERQGGAR